MRGARPGSPLVRQMQEAALYGETERWETLRRLQQENGDILDAAFDHLRSLGDLHVEYDLLDVEREGSHTFALYDDPEQRHRSYSPRCFAVTRREDGGFDFEEA